MLLLGLWMTGHPGFTARFPNFAGLGRKIPLTIC